jgi:hypothetical protein
MTSAVSHALAFAARGLRILPLHAPRIGSGPVRCSCGDALCESVGKHPRIARGCHGASADPERIRVWWRRWPHANVGMTTGSVSGILVLDVDPRHGGDETLHRLEAAHAALPETWRFLTGGGGEHILFRYPAGERLGNSAGRLGAGLDTRGEGGFIVAPPSLHASGRRYAISVDHHPDDLPLAEAPGWLLRHLWQPTARPVDVPGELRTVVASDAPEGRRNQTLASLCGHLLRHYVHPYAVVEIARCWNAARCRPPLADEEVVRVVNSICRRELARREAAR